MISRPEVCFVSGWAGTDSLLCARSVHSTPADDSVFAGLDAAYDSGCRDFIGHSLGAMLLLEYALRRPCRKLVLLSGTPCYVGELGAPESEVRAMRAALERNRESLLKGFFRRAASPWIMSSEVEDSLVERAGAFSTEALSQGLEYLRRTDLSAAVPSVDIPVLLLHGAQDRITPVRAAEHLRLLLPSAQLHIFPAAGHLIHLEKHDEIAPAIEEFLR